MAEVGADQLLALVADIVGQAQFALHLLEAVEIDGARLPVTAPEVLADQRQLGLAGAHVHGHHRVDDAARAGEAAAGASARRLDLERADDHAAGLRLEPGGKDADLRQTGDPRADS